MAMKNPLLYLSVMLVALAGCQGSVVKHEAHGKSTMSYGISNQKINAIEEDAQGHIWIGTFRGLNKYVAHRYYQYFCDDDSLGLPDNQVLKILNDSKGRLWVTTVNGICRYTDTDSFERIRWDFMNRNIPDLLEDSRGRIFAYAYPQISMYDEESASFRTVVEQADPNGYWPTYHFLDADDNLWVAAPNELTCYDPVDFRVRKTIGLEVRASVFHYDGEKLWIHSKGRLETFDPESGRFRDFSGQVSRTPSFRDAYVSVMYPYRDEGMIFCTMNDGLFYWDGESERLIHESEAGFPFEAPRFVVNMLFTDSQGNLWIGSADQGFKVVYRYKERFNEDNALRSFFEGKSVRGLAADGDGDMVISTVLDGQYIYNASTAGITELPMRDIGSGKWGGSAYLSCIMHTAADEFWAVRSDSKVSRFKLMDGRPETLDTYDVVLPMSLAATSDGTVWVGTASNSIAYLRKGDSRFSYVKITEGFTFIPGVMQYDEGRLLACAFANRPKLIDIASLEVTDLPVTEEDWAGSIARSVFIPVSLHKDVSGNIWMGTVANGLLRYDVDAARLRRVEGAACTDISSIEEDTCGNLWIGTLYGLSKYSLRDSTFTNYFDSDGIGGNQFADRASCVMPDGRLAFGGPHGVTFFNPRVLGGKKRIPLLFEGLKIHNESVSPLQDKEVISKHLTFNPDVVLRHDQNSFGLTFAALDYSEYERVNYEYKLEGFDRYWVDSGHSGEANYANVPAGRYKFHVRLSSNDSNIEPVENVLSVRVKPSPFLSWWAWLVYLAASSGMVGLMVVSWANSRKERMAASEAEREKAQEHLINQMNMNFFANVSHEFRTPLTLISGPVAELAKSSNLDGRERNLLAMVRRSVERMLRLVNQLLDFNKLEADAIRLQVRMSDVVAVVARQADIFRMNMESKGISLVTSGLEDTFLCYLDEDKMDKILGNLMSNALKFTPVGGQVSLSLDIVEADAVLGSVARPGCDSYVKVCVSNSGADIPEAEREKIFERYYQIRGEKTVSYNMGTGIGLYYARRLARLHHGDLFCTGREEGHGASFTLLLPADAKAYEGDDKVSQSPEAQVAAYPIPAVERQDEHSAEADRSTVMVVDDDTEIVSYLQTLLSPHYNVVCRFDADNAVKTMRESAPDCVLCDLVMPKKDGFQLCSEVRSDLQLCHIPIILVTANVAMENQVRGLDTGANAYVTKPFDPDFLLAMIRSQLSNRDNLRRMLSEATRTESIEKDALSPQDEKFMNDLYGLMESELSNTELNILSISERLHMSRTKLYYKIKGLTGENPGAFFKTYKLNRAAELIKEGGHTLSEVSDLTGFSALSVFSKAFKKQFGVMPSKYE